MIHDRTFLEAYEELIQESKFESALLNFFQDDFMQVPLDDDRLIYAAVFQSPKKDTVSLTMDKAGKVKLDAFGQTKIFKDLDIARKYIFKHAPKLRIDHTIARIRGN